MCVRDARSARVCLLSYRKQPESPSQNLKPSQSFGTTKTPTVDEDTLITSSGPQNFKPSHSNSKTQTLAEDDTLVKDKPLLNRGQVAVLDTLDAIASGETVTPTTGNEETLMSQTPNAKLRRARPSLPLPVPKKA